MLVVEVLIIIVKLQTCVMRHTLPCTSRCRPRAPNTCLRNGVRYPGSAILPDPVTGPGTSADPISVSPRVAAAPISTPLVLDAWRVALQSHTDMGWVECLLTGMREGFRIGLMQTRQCQSSQGNTPSATDKAEVVSSFLTSKCEKGRM